MGSRPGRIRDHDRMSRAIEEVGQALVDAGHLERKGSRTEDDELFAMCDLASLVEHRLFASLDPRRISSAERARFEPLATRDGSRIGPMASDYLTSYWILDGGRRAGTIAFWTMAMGEGFIHVSSLYVFPNLRGRGIAGRVLDVARDGACERELRGLWVPTHWSWQPAVRFYLDRGMWVRNWKHSLVFIETRDLPSWRLDVEGDVARFTITQDGGEVALIRASRRGDVLEWVEEPGLDADWETHHLSPGTMALALAVRGWPLIRSDELWAKRWNWSDCGQPEGLAAKIEVFEAVDRQDGFEVRTPRIARIPYRALDEIE